MPVYHQPKTLEEALAALQGAPGAVSSLAGGTDLLPRWSRGALRRPDAIVDLKGVGQLSGVSRANGEVRIGACTLMSEIESDPVIRGAAPLLAKAAGRVACPQIRNRATIGGNLCNASPAADSAIPLLLLDAVVDLASWRDGAPAQSRTVPLGDFFRGPGTTALASGEILTCIRFKPQKEGLQAGWDKFGTRPSMEIAVASVGVAIELDKKTVSAARIGYGSVAPTPLRGHQAEARLVGRPLSAGVIEECIAAAQDEIEPITDVRAGAEFRREIVAVTLRRMLESAGRPRQS